MSRLFKDLILFFSVLIGVVTAYIFVFFMILSFVAPYANAEDKTDNLFFKLGGSLNYESLATSKIASIGYQHDLAGHFQYQLEGGYFHDNTVNGGESVFFASPSLGLAVNAPGHYAKAFFGPAFLTQTDYRTSTFYEFNTDMEIGFRDERNVGIGLGYKHMSNAGISGNNAGRDFVYLKVQF